MDKLLKVQEIVDEFLEKGFGDLYKAEFTPLSDSEIKIDITGTGVSYLIGQHGKTLLSLQHLIRQIYINTTGDYEEAVKLIIDVDQYKQKRIERIKDIAAKAAEKCQSLGKEVTLPSMTPYERHIVHTHVQENFPELSSSSVGEEPNRKIVLRPGGSLTVA
jgi:spoIIIJ-associated protein